GRRTARGALGLVGLIVVVVPLIDLAYLLPRVGYLPRTSIALGYRHLFLLSKRLTGNKTYGLEFGLGVGNTWPVRLALSPGAYLGAGALALMFAGWRVRGQRYLAVGFATYGAICYVLMLQWFAHGLPNAFKGSSVGGFYFHDPSRFRFGFLIALAILAALGLEGWLPARSWIDRIVLIVPGVVVWFVLPRVLVAGAIRPLLQYGAGG